MSLWTPKRTHPNSHIFELDVTLPICAGLPGNEFLMGGIAMATAIEAAEQFTGRPLLWATIQFISPGALDSLVTIKVEQLGGGRNVSQVCVTLSAGDKIIQKMSAALGARDDFENCQFVKMPKVRPPEESFVRGDAPSDLNQGVTTKFERLRAFDCSETGVEYMWARPKFETPMSAPLLSITSDFILGAHQTSNFGKSIDNTLRIYSRQETDWILCVTQISGVANGFSHSTMHQFAQDGTLLSISSQTGIMKRP